MMWSLKKNIKALLLIFLSYIVSISLFAQNQNTIPVLTATEVIPFKFTEEQRMFWCMAEQMVTESLQSGIDVYSADFYEKASVQEKIWLDSIDSGDSPYNTDYRSKYWGNNWLYTSELTAKKSDSLAYDFNLLTAWFSAEDSDGIGEKITFVFEPTGSSQIKKVRFFAGNMRTPDEWAIFSRPHQVQLCINGKDIAILQLQDTMACQIFDIPLTASYKEDQDIKVEFEILSVYPGNTLKETVVSEINFDGTNIL